MRSLHDEIENHPNKSYWEDRILERANSVPVMESQWFASREFLDFIDAWFDLARFFAFHGETTLGIEVVREYQDFMRLLRLQLLDKNNVEPLRTEIADRIIDLDGALEEIIKEAVTNLSRSYPAP